MSIKVTNGLDLLGQKIENVGTPSSATDVATKSYVDAMYGGLSWKDNVRAASTGNVSIPSAPSSIDGVTLNNGDRVLLKDQSSVPANGIWIFNGAGSPFSRAEDADQTGELNNAVVVVDEGTVNAGTRWRQTELNQTLGSGNTIWQNDSSSVASASETVSGVAELATQSETDTGTDDLRIVTPLKLANWSGKTKKMTGNIGDASATQFDIAHNWGTRAVQVEVFRNSTPWDTVLADVSRPDTNTVRLNFATAPTSNQFTYVLTA